MKLVEEKILQNGKVLPGEVLKVDSFLNHQMDVNFLNDIGKEFYRLFKDDNINKILTIEASGIGIACLTAQYFKVPVVFAKKSKSSNLSEDYYCTNIASFTHKNVNNVLVSKEYLGPEDNVLIIDDFLAEGNACIGLMNIINQAGATLKGIGIVIEKGFEKGGRLLRNNNVKLRSLAVVKSMTDESILFDNQYDY